MKINSTLFLKFIIVLAGLIVLALCAFVLPVGIRSDQVEGYRPILIGMYIPVIPFFIALYQAMKLIGFIDDNNVFSNSAINSLKFIKYCGFLICALYTAGMPYIFYMAQRDDAPGVAAIGFIFIFASLVVATAAAIFQSTLHNVVDIKSENDLTI